MTDIRQRRGLASAVGGANNDAVADNEPDKRLELVLSEALRALSQQQSLLDNLRSRATVLTTAAAVVSSLLGGPALQARHVGWPVGLALTALAGVLLCTFMICGPWWRWYFRSSARALLAAVELGHDLDSMRRHLAGDFERWVDANDRTMRVLYGWFTAGLLLLFAEISGWVVQLIDGGT